ncbi:PREDICTED: uncharacterized protein LOC108575198 [Habropoda laboriosa]|uniref:uncharacterized protein LOC108575198 n=1 Tax=Habropoda laboriosa TaxID=597456 RepID=UPI00083D7CF9|nr:PREDICTED: uncharacterized protein LOC108575198 [Habropoda laboriosa]
MADKNVENSENQLEELYTWISGIPLSKPTKNLTRDFSDAVIMAEILKLYCPRYVDLHNYVPVNSLTAKKENWNILNRKVLSKINMKLTKDVIHQLANCQPGTAEHVLLELKKKISKDSEHQKSQDLTYNDKENDSIEEGKIDEHSMNNTLSKSLMPPPVNRSTLKSLNYQRSIFVLAKERFYLVLKWLINWLCIWNYFPSILPNLRLKNPFRNLLQENTQATRAQGTSENINVEDAVLDPVYMKWIQEIREMEDIICSLTHKITYLKSVMKLKDL